MISSLGEIMELAKKKPGGTIAVAAAHDTEVLAAVVMAHRERIADAILTGHKSEITQVLEEQGENPEDYIILEADTDRDCAVKAVAEVRKGNADFLMKGMLSTADMMRAVIDRETGIRTGKLLSHVMALQVPSYGKLMFLTDGGMNTFPDLEQKENILENAAILLKRLGYHEIYAACVCGAEVINPKIPSMVDAAELSGMDKWKKYDMSVFGPVGFDMAICKESCQHKHYDTPGAGEADILLVPTYEVGNGIGKALLYFAGAENAGVILGAKVPIILVSRSDPPRSKLASIALGKVVV